MAVDLLATLPTAAARQIALRVQPAAERSLREGHPWLFDGSIMRQSRSGEPGDLAVAFDRKGRFLAIGLYDPTSPIRLRVLQHGAPATIDEPFFASRIRQAVDRRSALAATGTDGYRLVHGENDGMPGLVVDRYADTLVLKLYTAAWIPHLAAVIPALLAVQPAARLVLRLSRGVQGRGAHLSGLHDGQTLVGNPPDGPVLFRENGLVFEAEPVSGQKTGFFLDQRDNRSRVERIAAGKRVLNVFAYNGGFSVYAGRGGAVEVCSLDINAAALAAAERNFAHNRTIAAVAAARHSVLAADAFGALAELAARGERYELVILDPPAFAKRQSETAQALEAYHRLTRLGLGVLAPGGLLVSASCSSRVPADAFFATLHAAATAAGRGLREIERTGQPLDHPIGFAEGAYLKCLFAVAD